jgi:acetolactate synthase I/III small subunit
MQGNPMVTFVIYVRRTQEVLGRVVSLFHRRAIEIERLTAGRSGRSEVLQIEVTVDCDHDGAQLIEANLYRIVDVLLVEQNHNREAAHQAAEGGHRKSRL